jgi:hypothetical protein
MRAKNGEIVRVEEAGGRVIERRVVRMENERVVVCSEEEYQSALLADRIPNGISFPINAIRP